MLTGATKNILQRQPRRQEHFNAGAAGARVGAWRWGAPAWQNPSCTGTSDRYSPPLSRREVASGALDAPEGRGMSRQEWTASALVAFALAICGCATSQPHWGSVDGGAAREPAAADRGTNGRCAFGYALAETRGGRSQDAGGAAFADSSASRLRHRDSQPLASAPRSTTRPSSTRKSSPPPSRS